MQQAPTNFTPQLRDLLNLFKREIFLDFNCHAIAAVESFDSATQRIKAKMLYCKTVIKDGLEIPIEYPLLVDIPMIILGGGNGRLTFPIAKGDQCLILFNDRDIDNWMAGAKSGHVASTRLHSFSDGIALIGFFKVASYDTTRVKLANGSTYVGISSSKVKVANSSDSLGVVLKSLTDELASLITAIKAITVSGVQTGAGVSGTPVNAASFTSINNNLTTISNKLQGLLE
jgi:hypothetical protein